MDARGSWRVFKSSFVTSLKDTIRYYSLRGWALSWLSMPIFLLLTTWMINNVMIAAPGTEAQQYFQGLTGTSSYLTFAILGTAFFGFIGSAVLSSGNGLRGEQESGTLELVFLTPANKFLWLLGKTLSDMYSGLFQGVVLIVLGEILFGLVLSPNLDLPLALFAVVLTVLGHVSFGFLYAGLAMLVRNSRAVNEALWPLMLFLGGIAFPVQILPEPLKFVSELLPLTHGLQIFRGALTLGWTFADALTEIFALCVITIAMLPFGYLVLKRIEKKARRLGTLSTY